MRNSKINKLLRGKTLSNSAFLMGTFFLLWWWVNHIYSGPPPQFYTNGNYFCIVKERNALSNLVDMPYDSLFRNINEIDTLIILYKDNVGFTDYCVESISSNRSNSSYFVFKDSYNNYKYIRTREGMNIQDTILINTNLYGSQCKLLTFKQKKVKKNKYALSYIKPSKRSNGGYLLHPFSIYLDQSMTRLRGFRQRNIIEYRRKIIYGETPIYPLYVHCPEFILILYVGLMAYLEVMNRRK